MMNSVQSNVPATDLELVENRHFQFTVGGVDFSMKPMSGKQARESDENIRNICLLLYYSEFTVDQIVETTFVKRDDVDESPPSAEKLQTLKKKLENTLSLSQLIVNNLDPIPFWQVWKVCYRHNRKVWFSPKNWFFSLQGFFDFYLPVHAEGQKTIYDILSYFKRYSTEVKKKVFQILQSGEIGCLTKDQKAANPTSLPLKDGGSRLVSTSLGMQALGSPDLYPK